MQVGSRQRQVAFLLWLLLFPEGEVKSEEPKQTKFNRRAKHQGLNLLSDAKDPIPARGAMSKYSQSLPTAAEVEVSKIK